MRLRVSLGNVKNCPPDVRRVGREAIETAYALKQLVTVGVRVFFYMEDRSDRAA